jgi:asparagine synthase (glutamine-hydrolysing)
MSLLRRQGCGDPLAELSQWVRDLIHDIKRHNLTYLNHRRLQSLATTCESIEQQDVGGLFIEAGCALGGSAILISRTKDPTRQFNIYDVFGMIPPPTEEDTQDVHDRYRVIVEGKSKGIGGDQYYGYVADLQKVVQDSLTEFGCNPGEHSVSLIKGLLQDTMVLDSPVAFAHVDVDWYEPVRTCLERICPRLTNGGSVILDDYHDWGGCRKATDEYLADHVGEFSLDDSAGSMKLTRVKS